MAEKASHVLTEQALNLQTKYHHLLELIQYLAQDANVDIVKTKLRTILEEKSLYQLHGISHYLQAIKGITNINEAFTFLVDNHFIGYLNYQLLKEFAKSKVICGDGYKKAKEKVLKYEKLYRKFIEEPSFCRLIEVFDENPHLNPSTVVGLPIILVSLSQKWKTRSTKDLKEWIPFIRENKHLLQSMGYKCILITYAIFPINLLRVMRFLNNANQMQRLKENGITIEVPSYTMEMAEKLRGAKNEESEIEESSCDDEEENKYSSLVERIENIEREQVLERAHYMVQLAITRAMERIKLSEIENHWEEKWSKAQKKIDSLHKILHDNLTKFEQVTEDMDLLKSDVQMMDRLHNRRNRSNRVLSKRPSVVKPAFKKLKTQLEASLEEPSLRKNFESKDSGLCSGYTSQGSSFISRATIN